MSGRNGELKSPVALPHAPWKDTLKRTVSEFREDKLNRWARDRPAGARPRHSRATTDHQVKGAA